MKKAAAVIAEAEAEAEADDSDAAQRRSPEASSSSEEEEVEEGEGDEPGGGQAVAVGSRQERQARALEVSKAAAEKRRNRAVERAEAIIEAQREEETAERRKKAAADDDTGSKAPSAAAAAVSAAEERRQKRSGARGKHRRVSVASVEDTFSVLAGWRPPDDPATESEEEQGAAAFEAAVEAQSRKKERRASNAAQLGLQDGETMTGAVKRGRRRASATARKRIDTVGAKEELARQARRQARQQDKERRAKRRRSIIAGRRDAHWLTEDQKLYLIRRQQFLDRIVTMRKQAEDSEAKRKKALEHVRELARMSQTERSRIGRAMAEVARAVRGESWNWVLMSSVRSGAPQEFEAGRLMRALAAEVVSLRSVLLARGRRAWLQGREARKQQMRCRVMVASADAKKASLMQLTKTTQQMEKAGRRGQGGWLQRGMGMAVAHAAKASAEEAGTTVAAQTVAQSVKRMTRQEKQQLLAHCFQAWSGSWRDARHEKTFLRSVIMRMLRARLSIGFNKWVGFAQEHGEWWKSGGKGGGRGGARPSWDTGGRGTLQLIKASGAREGLMATAARVLEHFGQGNAELHTQSKAERWRDDAEKEGADEDSDAGSVVGETTAEEKAENQRRRAIGLSAGAADIVAKRRKLAQAERHSGALALATGGAEAAAQDAAASQAREYAVVGKLRLARSLEERTLQRRLLRRLFESTTVWEPEPPNEAAIVAANEMRRRKAAALRDKQRERRERAEKYRRRRERQKLRRAREERLAVLSKAGLSPAAGEVEDVEPDTDSDEERGGGALSIAMGDPGAAMALQDDLTRGISAAGASEAGATRGGRASPRGGSRQLAVIPRPRTGGTAEGSTALTPYTEKPESDGGLVLDAAMGDAFRDGASSPSQAGRGSSRMADTGSSSGPGLGTAGEANTPFFAHVTASAFFRSRNYDGAQKQYAKLGALSEESITALRERVRAISTQARLLARRVRVGVAKRLRERKEALGAAKAAGRRALDGVAEESSAQAGSLKVSHDGPSESDDDEAESLLEGEEEDIVVPLGFHDAAVVFDAETLTIGVPDIGLGSSAQNASGELAARWNSMLPPPATILGDALSRMARHYAANEDLVDSSSVLAGTGTPLSALPTGTPAGAPALKRQVSGSSFATGDMLKRGMSTVSLTSLNSEERSDEVARRGWAPLAEAGLVSPDALDAMVQLKERLTTASQALESEETRRRAVALRAMECAAKAGDIAVALDGYSRLRRGLEREGDLAGAAVVCEREAWLAARRGQLSGATAWTRRAQRMWKEAIETHGEADRAAIGVRLGAEIMWLVGARGEARPGDAWLLASVADARAARLSDGRGEAARGLARTIGIEECLCALTGDNIGAARARARRVEFGLDASGDGFGVLRPAPAAVASAMLLDGVSGTGEGGIASDSAGTGQGGGDDAAAAREAIRKRRQAGDDADEARVNAAALAVKSSTSSFGVKGLLEAARERRRQSVVARGDGEPGADLAKDKAEQDSRRKSGPPGAANHDAVALEQRLAAADANLRALTTRLQLAVAKSLPDLSLEQVSVAVPPLRAKVRACRRMIAALDKAVQEMERRRKDLGDATEEDAATLAVLRSTTATHIDIAVTGGATAAAEAKRARTTGGHVATQRMTVAEARFLIQTRLEMAEKEREELLRRIRVAEVRIRNLSDTLQQLAEELAASTGALASAALGRRAVRAAALYTWNAACNNVMGRGRTWAMDGAGGEVEVVCPNCGAGQVMGGGRGRTPIPDSDEVAGAGDARAKLLALRRARASKQAAASGGQGRKGGVSSAAAGRSKKKQSTTKGGASGGGGGDEEEAWDRTPLARFVSARGRALRKSSSAVVGAAKVAQAQAKSASGTIAAATAADAASSGGADSFDLLTGGGASAVGMSAVADEGKVVFDDEEDEEAEEREGIEPGSVVCSACNFVLGGALLGLCPYMAAVQGDDVVVHRIFRAAGESVEEEKRYRTRMGDALGSSGAVAPTGSGDRRDKRGAAAEHPLARLRLLRERTERRKLLLDKLVGAAGRKNKSAAQQAAAALFQEEEEDEAASEREGPGRSASAATAMSRALRRPPPVITKAVRVISGDWRALLARGVRGLGMDGGLNRDKQLGLLVMAGRLGNKALVEHFAGPVEVSSGVPGATEGGEDDEAAGTSTAAASGAGGDILSAKVKNRIKSGPKPKAGDAAAEVKNLADRMARGLIDAEGAAKAKAKMETAHREYLQTLKAGHGRAVSCVAMTASRLYTGSADASVRVWNWRTGDVVGELVGHRGTITCMALDIDARTIATGSSDMSARLWDTLTFRCLRTLRKHEGGITCLALFRDMFVTGSSDKSVGVWDLSTQPLRNEAADELEALAEDKLHREGAWAAQLNEALKEETAIERKLDNDEPSDEDERAAMGRNSDGGNSIKTDDLFKTSSESSDVSGNDDEEELDSGDVSTTDSDDIERKQRITVWEKEQRMLDILLGEREPPRPDELKVRVTTKGRLAGVGYK